MNRKPSPLRNVILLVSALMVAAALYAEYRTLSYPGNAPRTQATSAPLPASAFQDGDIIFQITESPQSRAIQAATGSRYTHCGIIFEKDGRPQVFEAVSTVRWTPLEEWIQRGRNGHYVLMRLKNSDRRLSVAMLQAMRRAGTSLAGKPYDLLFQWSDDTIYCSELVWKIYQRGAGIELTPVRRFKDFHLDNPAVIAIIEKRYGHSINLEEEVVAPSDLMDSPLLVRVGGE